MNTKSNCECIDCGGDKPAHSDGCDYMRKLHGETAQGEQQAVAWMVFTSVDDTHATTDPREADDARDDGYEVRPLVFGDDPQPAVLNDPFGNSEQLAAPAAPAPVAGDAVSEMVRTAPKRIYLQVADEDYSHESFPHDSEDQVTWCASSCVECEVEYVRADLAQDRASQGAAAGVPEGWQLVPVEATPEMLDSCALDMSWKQLRHWWAAMLAAAPSAPTQGAEP